MNDPHKNHSCRSGGQGVRRRGKRYSRMMDAKSNRLITHDELVDSQTLVYRC